MQALQQVPAFASNQHSIAALHSTSSEQVLTQSTMFIRVLVMLFKEKEENNKGLSS